jgi:hypothetical protein
MSTSPKNDKNAVAEGRCLAADTEVLAPALLRRFEKFSCKDKYLLVGPRSREELAGGTCG